MFSQNKIASSRPSVSMICTFAVWFVGLALVSRPANAVDEFDPRAQASIEKGVGFLYKNMLSGTDGKDAIAAYALMKAGESEENAEIAEVIKRVAARAGGGSYNVNFEDKLHQLYIAAVDLLVLAEANPEKYQAEIRTIKAFIKAQHADHGGFSYPDNRDGGGDTSLTQYAALALWATTQSGIDVEPEMWDRIAGWCVATQLKNGSFAYHPSKGQESTHSMAVGGLQTLLIARMHLFPKAFGPGTPEEPPAETEAAETSEPKKSISNKFNVLEKVELEDEPALTTSRAGKRHSRPKSPKDYNYTPRTSLDAINTAIAGGHHWLEEQFTVTKPTGWKYYYMYGLERYAALAGVDVIAGHDWYGEGIAEIVKHQQPEGGWGATQSASSALAETSFCILFLTKATSRMYQPIKSSTMVGTGLLVGGRGLPDDLNQLEMKGSRATKKKNLGEIDDLLKALENPQLMDVEAAQAGIIETVQLGDREKLIEQKDRLLVLAVHPDPEVKRTALWALGRTGDIRMAPVIMRALADNNVDVLVEANNALCWLSRRPLGVKIPDSPFDEVPEGATDEQKQNAVEPWRKQAQTLWNEWYQQARPYDQRDDLSEQVTRKPQKSR